MKTRAAAIMSAILGHLGMSTGVMSHAIPSAPANEIHYVPGRAFRRSKGSFNKTHRNYRSRNSIDVVEARSRNGVGRPPDHKRKIS